MTFLSVYCINRINKKIYFIDNYIAGWSSLVARQAHNLKVLGSNPSPATKIFKLYAN